MNWASLDWTPTRRGPILRTTGNRQLPVDETWLNERWPVEREAELREFVAARSAALSRSKRWIRNPMYGGSCKAGSSTAGDVVGWWIIDNRVAG